MIFMHDFKKFCSTIDELKSSNIQLKLFGQMEEKFSGAYAGFEAPLNNTLSIHIVALTSIGTFYCHEGIKLKDSDAVEIAKKAFESLSVSQTDVSFNKETGCIIFK